MTTKLIAALIVVAILFGGWHLYFYWERVKNEEESVRKTAAAVEITGDQLQGLPEKLAPTLQAAQAQGAAGLRNWLKTYGKAVKDPRKAWIELDYCVAVTREDPAEARRIFTAVKDRTPRSSPVYPRMEKLAKTYE
jgi:hypothetical protein